MTTALPLTDLHAMWEKAQKSGLDLSDLEPICHRFGMQPGEVLNELSLRLAERYLTGALMYELCDEVMNGIANAIFNLGTTSEFPQPAYALYLAFDNGEWGQPGDRKGILPSEKYTRPVVTKILGDHRSQGVDSDGTP
jgi:hypothetical protein